ncbi:hypothetical protein [Sphingomonas jatrophae]|uniref:Hemerythrin HHE cation binding domain-containing protein n=1 Tax=Sphingomonas jatrophae TaxID=1166337 RepID=A0A1I6JRH8_9SPHN|nr:hypothetical protein [Sphingomonas jatrophae]SFR81120.1 hypothetical protein SAMN05192580_0666 [Sphingomonas jatrophae]
MSFERLMREHDELERMSRALLLVASGEPDAELAALILYQFTVQIKEHRAFEQNNVYRPLIELAQQRDLGENLDLQALVIEMARDWRAYFETWTVDTIRQDWKAFSEDTRYILAQGQERLRLENMIIYPLALRHGTIRLKELA